MLAQCVYRHVTEGLDMTCLLAASVMHVRFMGYAQLGSSLVHVMSRSHSE